MDPMNRRNVPTFDADYLKRLVFHLATLVAYEDSSLAYDEDRLMLALVFVRNHVDMVSAEFGRLNQDGEIQE